MTYMYINFSLIKKCERCLCFIGFHFLSLRNIIYYNNFILFSDRQNKKATLYFLFRSSLEYARISLNIFTLPFSY